MGFLVGQIAQVNKSRTVGHSAGLADLSKGLVDLKTEAEGFYKYRARSGEPSGL